MSRNYVIKVDQESVGFKYMNLFQFDGTLMEAYFPGTFKWIIKSMIDPRLIS